MHRRKQFHTRRRLPKHRVDLIYLCYPNNPTGTTLTHEQLKKWVDYALSNDTLIIFDAAYEAFIQEPNVPHSIYEIRGAKKVAIEIRSFSKTAGFTVYVAGRLLPLRRNSSQPGRTAYSA